MNQYEDYCIEHDSSLRDALAKLNLVHSLSMTLFVTRAGRVLGAITDGDIRRALINGVDIHDSVSLAMNPDFRYMTRQSPLSELRRLRSIGVTLIPVLDAEGMLTGVYDLSKYRSVLPVDAVLMAGGKGERLRPLTDHTPKPLLPVGDKAIIDHNVDRLISYGIEHINVTVNYLRDQIEEHYARPVDGVKVRCIPEPHFLGTIGSVKLIDRFYNDTVLVMNSDLFTNINYEDFYLHFKEYDADMSVAAVPYSVAVPYGIMDLDGRNLRGMIEKPTYNYYANGGIYLLRREMLEHIPKGEFYNATDLIEQLISSGRRVIRFPINGTWIDIGNPQEYQKACDLVKHIS